MKYGQQLEQESVPEWSLHNLDYNALKREIKAHTTHHGAAAVAIPGHPDLFEDGLYTELVRQHDRLHLFVNSKADEISRRLDHLASSLDRCIVKSAAATLSLRRHTRLARYERQLICCGQDIAALSRFVNAQVVAFRKILKKYRKWSGSSALSSRFTESTLASPKSFTKRDFAPLQARYHDLLAHLRASARLVADAGSPSSADLSQPEPSSLGRSPPPFGRMAEPPSGRMAEPPVKYWNEYDDGSDDGAPDDDDYAIYVDPHDDADFPGLGYVRAMTTLPYEKAKQWFERHKAADDSRPLLSSARPRPNYASAALDSDEEAASSCDSTMPRLACHDVPDKAMTRYRQRVLLRGTVACFAASLTLVAVSALLISTGKQPKFRVQVDAGVTLGAMVSLLCACTGLGMTLYQTHSPPPPLYRLAVWAAFAASCLMNGMLLVMVLGSAP